MAYIVRKIVRIVQLLINSIYYLSLNNPLVVCAYVTVRNGKICHKNWGDDLNVFLLEALTKRPIIIKNESLYHKLLNVHSYICIGSVIDLYSRKNAEIWGAGYISFEDSLLEYPMKVHSVRGAYTRKRLLEDGMECPIIYGDPALLVSKIYTPQKIGHYRLGIIPHGIEQSTPIIEKILKAYGSTVILIDLVHYEKWTDVLDMIYSCDMVLSSSLHGLIASDSYGVPNRWVKFSNHTIRGGDFKYLDYFSSVGRNDSTPINIESLEQIDHFVDVNYNAEEIHAHINYDAIIQSCPFEINFNTI